jgi:hypothetical protein
MNLSKTFRLFISSTFEDFRLERDVLQREVFPYISELCSKYGFNFMPIDLRWGVSNEAQLDQKTLEICLNELNNCKNDPHPDLLILTGSRYGWIPIPTKIERNEFEIIYNNFSKEELNIINNWYFLDENELPSSYILKQRDGNYIDSNCWFEEENKIRRIFQETVLKTSLDNFEKEKYFTSATDFEILEYLKDFNKDKEDSILVINRKIDTEFKSNKYFDENKKLDDFKLQLKNIILEDNYIDVNATLENENNISNSHIKQFIDVVKQKLEKSIIKELSNTKILEQDEISFQKDYLESISQDIIGREDEIKHILEYINDNSQNQPLILFGQSGIGKSFVMAKTIKEIENKENKNLIYRFCGISNDSSSSKKLLFSIFSQLNIERPKDDNNLFLELCAYSKEINNVFELGRLYEFALNSIKDEIIIFIDAYDQLEKNGELDWLPSLLPSNIKIVLSVLNDEKYKDESEYFNKLSSMYKNLYEIHDIKKQQINEILLNLLSKKYNRTLQNFQLEYIDSVYKKINSPFYLKVISQEVKNWNSQNKDIHLAFSKENAIDKYLDNLVLKSHNNKLLVERFFGYIISSQFSLREVLIYEILSNDEEVLISSENEFHINQLKKIPQAVWSRFFEEISFFIKKDEKGNINFFHREFNHSVEKYYTIEISNKLLDILENILKNSSNENQTKEFLEVYLHTLAYQYEIFEVDIGNRIDFLVNEYEEKDSVIEIINQLNLINIDKFGDSIFINKTISYQFINYSLFKIMYLKNKDRWIKAYIKSLSYLGTGYSIINRIKDAIILEKLAVEILEKEYLMNMDIWVGEYTLILSNLAYSYFYINKKEDAIVLQEKVLEIRKKLYLINKISAKEYSTILSSLATSYFSTDRKEEAITLQKEALKIRRNEYLKDKNRWIKHYLSSLNSLAFYYSEDKIKEAIILQEEALVIVKNEYFKNRNKWFEDYSFTLNHLGLNYLFIEKVDEGLALLIDAFVIINEVHKKNKDRWINLYIKNIISSSISFKLSGKLKNAIILEELVVEVLEDAYLKDKDRWIHVYAKSLNDLSVSYNSILRISDAIILQEEAVFIIHGVYKKNKNYVNDYLEYIVNLSCLYTSVKRYKESIVFGEKALKILEELNKKYEDKYLELYSRILSTLSNAYFSITKVEKALILNSEALKIRERAYLKDKDKYINDYSKSLTNQAYCFNSIDKINDATILHIKALEISKEVYKINQDRWNLYLKNLNILAVFYYENEEYQKSLKLFKEQYSISKNKYDKNSPEIKQILENIKIVESKLN